MAEINFSEALADPPDLTVEPLGIPRRPRPPLPAVEIPNQLLSARRSFETRDELLTGQRDLNDPVNDEDFLLVGSLAVQPSTETVKIEFDVSVATRTELGLDPEDQSLFIKFRNPQLARSLSVQYLVAMGLEQVLEEDVREF